MNKVLSNESISSMPMSHWLKDNIYKIESSVVKKTTV